LIDDTHGTRETERERKGEHIVSWLDDMPWYDYPTNLQQTLRCIICN